MKEDVLEIEVASPTDLTTPAPGPPSTEAFIESFNRKLNDCGRSVANIRSSNFNAQSRPIPSSGSSRSLSKIPPRLLSDQYISRSTCLCESIAPNEMLDLFFQEWQPLLPLFHRPSFLRIYEQFMIDPEASHWHSNKTAVAQLYLIFDIAAISSISRIKQNTTSYEQQWKKALHSMPSSPSSYFDSMSPTRTTILSIEGRLRTSGTTQSDHCQYVSPSWSTSEPEISFCTLFGS